MTRPIHIPFVWTLVCLALRGRPARPALRSGNSGTVVLDRPVGFDTSYRIER